jgi:hypothetical protein
MSFTRRSALQSFLFGAGAVGLRALATGIPAAVLTHGARAIAATPTACANAAKAQYIIFNTSGLGDPINANAPGTYGTGALAGVVHCPDPGMVGTSLTLGGVQTMAALPWTQLPSAALSRLTVWHIATQTPVHPREPDVLALYGATAPNEMLPSLLARTMAPCLNGGTIQTQPITVGATTPSEGLSYAGQALPIIPPLALKATLTAPNGPLDSLQMLRDQTLGQLDTIYKSSANTAQSKYIDQLITSESQVRSIKQSLLSSLSTITDNSVASQITAALALIQMNVTPVIAVHIPFGSDNHNDTALATEASETISGMASVGSLITQLNTLGLQDQVTFMSLNVFGRTIGAGTQNGRQHNPNHQVSFTIGKGFKPGIIGGIQPVSGDFGALPIVSTSGLGSTSGDVMPQDSLASFGQTMLAGVGVDAATISGVILNGSIVTGALAT